MTEYFTIYCQIPNKDSVFETIQNSGFQILEHNEQSIEVQSDSGTMKVNFLFPEVGGKYGRVYAGTLTRAKSIKTEFQNQKDILCEALRKTNMILGMVFDPELSDDENRFRAIFEISKTVSGIVFDGFTFLNSDVQILLNLDGNNT
jgi:hypothetical protein